MKERPNFKIIIPLLFLILFPLCVVSEESDCFTIEQIHIGNTYGHVVSLLEHENISYEITANEESYTIIELNLDLFGIINERWSPARLYFNENKLLQGISASLDENSIMEIYCSFSNVLGNADIVSQPYIEYEADSSYVSYSFPMYIVWIGENEFWELSIYTRLDTEINSSFWDGLEIDCDDTPYQRFELSILPIDDLNDQMRFYE